VAVLSQVKVRGRRLSLRPIDCTPALSATKKRQCSCVMRLMALYKCYMPLPIRIVKLKIILICLFVDVFVVILPRLSVCQRNSANKDRTFSVN